VRPVVSGAASGVVIGFAVVFLLQQAGVLSLSEFLPALAYVLSAAIAGGVVFGIGGWLLGRSAVRRAQEMLAKEGPVNPTSPSKDASESDATAPKSP
jgi:cytochrome c biogenesis protein CcdA